MSQNRSSAPDLARILRQHRCRFITGEPAGIDTRWCDAPVAVLGASYCGDHMLICYAPAVPGVTRLTPTVARMRGAA